MREQLKWHDDKADNSPWLDALAELGELGNACGAEFFVVEFD